VSSTDIDVVGTMHDAIGRVITVGVRGHEVVITSDPHSGKLGRISLAHAAQQEELGRLYGEACRRASATATATAGSGDR
jgi:hypothetical protein